MRDRRQMLEDCLEHTIHVCKHLLVPETDYSITGPLNLVGSLRIERFPLIVAVAFAVNLDDKAGRKANEVGNVLTNRMLAAELVSGQLVGSKLPPQVLFGFVRVPS